MNQHKIDPKPEGAQTNTRMNLRSHTSTTLLHRTNIFSQALSRVSFCPFELPRVHHIVFRSQSWHSLLYKWPVPYFISVNMERFMFYYLYIPIYIGTQLRSLLSILRLNFRTSAQSFPRIRFNGWGTRIWRTEMLCKETTPKYNEVALCNVALGMKKGTSIRFPAEPTEHVSPHAWGEIQTMPGLPPFYSACLSTCALQPAASVQLTRRLELRLIDFSAAPTMYNRTHRGVF